MNPASDLYFSDVFGVAESDLDEYGAFNVSLVVDLPLFIDPFLLFNSQHPPYQALHTLIIDYLKYLRDQSLAGQLNDGRLRALFCFSEVQQNWLGFSQTDNRGRGLGMDFARALADNLNKLFADFGNENITRSSHLEKLCLIRAGVGRDMISDFTTNLIKRFLCEFTEGFAKKHLDPARCATFSVERVTFYPATGTWAPGKYLLPKNGSDFVLLTPKDLLTKDDTWINKEDFIREYHDIPTAIGDAELRDRIDAYFQSVLPRRPTKKEEDEAVRKTALQFPVLIDYFIKHKEDTGDEAERRSIAKVEASMALYIRQFGQLVEMLRTTEFYREPLASKDAALEKVRFLKDVIENKGGHRIFYHNGQAIRKEEDLQILYRLVWHRTRFDVSREVNDGRGPADFKVSVGATNKTLVEMKLASNTGLRRNLEKQVEIYQKASDAPTALKVIIYFSQAEQRRVAAILRQLKLDGNPDIVLIDARVDNKPSGSKAA
ncbi:MAG: hypothetical protein Q8M02_04825 [Candidatus Didemnitutus sp.]|nr:hypothetical protein [Candidatus Didemnitutus sp.]